MQDALKRSRVVDDAHYLVDAPLKKDATKSGRIYRAFHALNSTFMIHKVLAYEVYIERDVHPTSCFKYKSIELRSPMICS